MTQVVVKIIKQKNVAKMVILAVAILSSKKIMKNAVKKVTKLVVNLLKVKKEDLKIKRVNQISANKVNQNIIINASKMSVYLNFKN